MQLDLSPYKGLSPFLEADAGFFFGREAETRVVYDNLMASRLTLLYGPAGVGMTSLLSAGVVARLRRDAPQNVMQLASPGLAVVVFSSWTADPVKGLARAARDAVDSLVGGTEPGDWEAEPRLVPTLHKCAELIGGELFIILDQFEEYFLYHPHEFGNGTFADEFPRVINDLSLPASVLVAMHEDSLAKLDRFKGELPRVLENYLRVNPLGRDGAVAAIEGPLRQWAALNGDLPVTIEPELVRIVIDQVGTGMRWLGDAGEPAPSEQDFRVEPAYLQLVMAQLWRAESYALPRMLRLQTLEELGGAQRIVGTHVDQIMSALTREDQDIAAQLLRFLATPSRTALTVEDLEVYSGVSKEALMAVVERLAASDRRLLRPVLDVDGGIRYQVLSSLLIDPLRSWRSAHSAAFERERSPYPAGRTRRSRAVGVLTLLVCILLILVLAETVALIARSM